MEEQTQNSQAVTAHPERAGDDPDKTLVAPRFDAREALTAQPVVPLAASPRASRERRQSTLPLMLILISALVGGLVSVFAYRLYQQRVEQSAAREQQQQPAYVEAPALTPEIPVREEEAAAATPDPTPEVIEEPEPTPEAEVAEMREASTREPEEATAPAEAREDRAGRDLGTARAPAAREERPATRGATTKQPTARRVEEITAPTDDLRVRRERRRGREASDYEAPARPRANRRPERRAAQRNIDRVRAIFEGSPPAH